MPRQKNTEEQIDETVIETERDFLLEFANCNLSRKIVDKLVVIFRISAIYIFWICLHYVSSYLYIKMCVPYNLFGFFASPFLITTPHCQAFRWVIYTGAAAIENMWLLLGVWLCSTASNFSSRRPPSASAR